MRGLVHGSRLGAVLIAVAMLALAGCGGSGKQGAASAQSTSPEGTWSRPDAPPDPHTLLRAGALAVGQVPDSALIFIESQTNDAGTWKVRVVTPDGSEQQLKIGADGVAVLVGPASTNDSDGDKAKRRANIDGAHLDYEAAVGKILAEVPNGSITGLSLVDMNGTIVWDADVWDTELVEHDVTINAATGAVTANRQV
ncbi:PepSY domain-containing protein [Mycobacterium sp. M1]|uniref:PepSY domain-containing protein n=1 Tax=Mycolicibacter acidiphilus TaxID=2835306 RepID=A0ABS5RGR8_9MYCO|nr:metallopeptidase [Mycolicibacter acidiphilus]MBS9533369.1 PepSY domain-containing protein [Mycolicibacter acidiphilus]